MNRMNTPLPTVEEILTDTAASEWLKAALDTED
jgi:hypothetical protein